MAKQTSWLDKIGHDFKLFFGKALPVAEVAGETVMPLFFPAITPLFNLVVGLVAQTEQKFAAMGQQTGTGTQKLAEVLAIGGPSISQFLSADGKAADALTVTNFVNAVVAILNAIPAAIQQPAVVKP